MLTAIIFIIILGLLIFVHELGHFLVARRNGIKAEEFGFGFPPRMLGFIRNEKTGKLEFVRGNKNIESKNTVYSLNWIPLGGFVKIKGEDGGGEKDLDSFVSRSAWTRIKVLAAGVIMNFILAWALLSAALMIGAPQEVEEGVEGSKVRIYSVIQDSPASGMGIKEGDVITEACSDNSEKCSAIGSISDLREIANGNKGKEILLKVERGKESLALKGTPRVDYPDDQGPLGVQIVQTKTVSYPFHEAIAKGAVAVFNFFIIIFTVIKGLIIGQSTGINVVGPVGIALMTKQVTALGFVYILQFAATLSLSLGFINGLPFPALDGGRILFILIEKIKGSPISQRVENVIHTTGFFLLIALMVFVTFRDIMTTWFSG